MQVYIRLMPGANQLMRMHAEQLLMLPINWLRGLNEKEECNKIVNKLTGGRNYVVFRIV